MRFGLTDDELAERIPSGHAKLWQNRVGWATSYLFNVGALARPRRSVYQITDRGQTLLQENPERVDIGVLTQYPELREFRSARDPSGTPEISAPPIVGTSETTPEEAIDASYRQLRAALARELLDQIAAQDSDFFEQLVLDLLQAMGYGGDWSGASLRRGGPNDEGIDGVIYEDRLGLDVVYVQAKQWSGTVGRPVIQAFVGALQGARASKGVIMTTSTFAASTADYVERVSPRIVMIDGRRLAELMIDHDVGVTTATTYRLKRIDQDYFVEPD